MRFVVVEWAGHDVSVREQDIQHPSAYSSGIY